MFSRRTLALVTAIYAAGAERCFTRLIFRAQSLPGAIGIGGEANLMDAGLKRPAIGLRL